MAQDPLCLLVVEPRFPGRLGAVADWLVRKRGYRCWFFCNQATGPREWWPPSVGRGLEVVGFNVGGVAQEGAVHWTRTLERGLCYAYGAWEVLEQRRPRPVDVVLGRSAGLGSTLYVPVYAPAAPIVNLFDYYVHPRSNDLAIEDADRLPLDYVHWRTAANAMDLLDLENTGVTPWTLSAWQRDLYPPEYRGDFAVIPEGVDLRRFRSPAMRSGSAPRTINGRSVPRDARVVTFVAPEPDRLRGFDRFLALSNRLMRERSDVICIAAGGGAVRRALDVEHFGRDYAATALAAEPPHDPERFWMLGRVAPGTVVEMLMCSDLHVDPSRPYPVSRSLLEAGAAGAAVLAWDSTPVREVFEPDRHALLVPADDPDAASRRALEILDDPAGFRPLGEAAAAVVRERFDRDACLAGLAELLDGLAKGRGRGPAG